MPTAKRSWVFGYDFAVVAIDQAAATDRVAHIDRQAVGGDGEARNAGHLDDEVSKFDERFFRLKAAIAAAALKPRERTVGWQAGGETAIGIGRRMGAENFTREK